MNEFIKKAKAADKLLSSKLQEYTITVLSLDVHGNGYLEFTNRQITYGRSVAYSEDSNSMIFIGEGIGEDKVKTTKAKCNCGADISKSLAHYDWCDKEEDI